MLWQEITDIEKRREKIEKNEEIYIDFKEGFLY
jgi:hypothetical protein